MALTDFWQIKDHQVYNGKPLLNVYQAKRIDVGANATLVGEAFRDTVIIDDLLALQPVGVTRTVLEIANLGDETDFITIDTSAHSGTLVGQNLPSFNAATIQFNRTRNDMKNGVKRYLVGTEGEQTGGEWLAAFITSLNVLANAVKNPWERAADPGTEIAQFVILKRFCVDPVQDPCLVYRLPKTDAEADDNFYIPLTAIARTRVRSQVSRKVLL